MSVGACAAVGPLPGEALSAERARERELLERVRPDVTDNVTAQSGGPLEHPATVRALEDRSRTLGPYRVPPLVTAKVAEPREADAARPAAVVERQRGRDSIAPPRQ